MYYFWQKVGWARYILSDFFKNSSDHSGFKATVYGLRSNYLASHKTKDISVLLMIFIDPEQFGLST
jgi:hypothetical protein